MHLEIDSVMLQGERRSYSLLLVLLVDQWLVDVWDDTTTSNCGLQISQQSDLWFSYYYAPAGWYRSIWSRHGQCLWISTLCRSKLICHLWCCREEQSKINNTLMRVSSSSSPRMASCRCLGVIRFTCCMKRTFNAMFIILHEYDKQMH